MRITTLFVYKQMKELLSLFVVLCVLQSALHESFAAVKSPSKSGTKKSEAKDSTDRKSSNNDSDEESKPKSEREDKSGAEEQDSGSESSKSEDNGPDETPSVLTVENLPEKLSAILDPASKNSSWGVKVVLAETGQTLFESKSDQGFIPASNRKLFTGALALDQLGPDHVFHTFLYYTGNIDAQGVLNGNLVIIPSGDPTFSTTLYKASHPDWVFRDWASKVQAAGIKYIKGDLLVDCSAWDMNDLTPHGWPARVINDSYAPQTSPLTINENLTNIVLNPSQSGQPADVSFIPAATGYPVVNKTESGKKREPHSKTHD